MTKSLDRRCNDHRNWLASSGVDGQRFVADGEDLQAADLSGRCLCRASLKQASLEVANLEGADLTGADLTEANLHAARLCGATLHGARLVRTQLKESVGLSSQQLGGSDLEGAELPEGLLRDQDLEPVRDTTRMARNSLLGLLLVCSYQLLVLSDVSDLDLFAHSRSYSLPILDFSLDASRFVETAAFLILLLFLFFLVQLASSFEQLARWPVVFPNGRTVVDRVSPWIFTPLVRCYSPLLFRRPGTPSFLRRFPGLFVGWMVVPLTLTATWIRYLATHNLIETLALALLLSLSVYLARESFRRLPVKITSRALDERISRSAVAMGVVVAVAAVAVTLMVRVPAPESWEPARWLRDHTSADFSGETLDPMSGLAPGPIDSAALLSGGSRALAGKNLVRADLAGLIAPGLNLSGSTLQGATARRAYLPLADLGPDDFYGSEEERRTNLRGSDLREAILIGIDGRNLDMRDADLRDACLQGADLRGARLQKADLSGADLSYALLDNAQLQEADLYGARLHGASLVNSNLTQSDLRRSVLEEADLSLAELAEARLDGAFLSGSFAVDPYLREANLTDVRADCVVWIDANAVGAWLTGSSLRGADLSGGNLTQANLEWADLSGACLSGTRFIKAVASGVRFVDSDLRSARLSGANMIAARFERARLVSAWLDGADLRGSVLVGADLTRTRKLGESSLERAHLAAARVGSDELGFEGWREKLACEPREIGLHNHEDVGRLQLPARPQQTPGHRRCNVILAEIQQRFPFVRHNRTAAGRQLGVRLCGVDGAHFGPTLCGSAWPVESRTSLPIFTRREKVRGPQL